MRNVLSPRTSFFNTPGSATVASSTTVFGAVTCGSSLNASEPGRQSITPKAGTFKYAYVRTSTTQSANNSMVFTMSKNTSLQSIVITIAAGSAAGTFSDLTNSVSASAGDKLAWKIQNNATATSAAITSIGVFFNT